MEKQFRRRPSPALIVALVAVVLAVAGTATAALTKKDKKQIRNIADQEIATKAGGLSVANAAKAGNADALGGVAASGYQQGGGHTFNGTTSGAANSSDNLVLNVPGIGQLEFDCAANGLDTTPKLVNSSGATLFALGQTLIGGAPVSLDPDDTAFNNGDTLPLMARQFGVTTLQLWSASADKTATITLSDSHCVYTASAVTNQ